MCLFLPEEDKKYLASKIRDVEVKEQSNIEVACSTVGEALVSQVDVVASLVLEASHRGVDTKLTLDSGAESDLITMQEAKRIGAVITSTRQRTQQADGSTPLQTLEETKFELERGHHKFVFNRLVGQNLSVYILVSMPLQHYNDVFVRPARKTIHIGDCCTFQTVGNGRRGCKPNRGVVASVLRVPA